MKVFIQRYIKKILLFMIICMSFLFVVMDDMGGFSKRINFSEVKSGFYTAESHLLSVFGRLLGNKNEHSWYDRQQGYENHTDNMQQIELEAINSIEFADKLYALMQGSLDELIPNKVENLIYFLGQKDFEALMRDNHINRLVQREGQANQLQLMQDKQPVLNFAATKLVKNHRSSISAENIKKQLKLALLRQAKA